MNKMLKTKSKIQSALDDKYEIKGLIGEGGMGRIYLGIHRELGRLDALKIIHQEFAENEEFRERFRREARLAAGLNHPGIINIYDFDSKDDFAYLTMPYIDGTTLKENLRKEGKLDVQECLRLMISIADALAYAHDRDVVHRDIKPANIMIDKQGNTILTDFGISKGQGDIELTVPGTVMGSPRYMSPEQIKGDPMDRRGDLYALGFIFYEMLTGKHPFQDKDTISIFHCQVNERPSRPEASAPEIPSQLGDIVMKLIEKSPDKRYLDGYELKRDIENCRSLFSGDSENPAKGSDADPVVRERKSYKRMLLSVSGLTLILLAGIVRMTQPPDVIKPGDQHLTVSEQTKELTPQTKPKVHGTYKPPFTDISFDSVVRRTIALGEDRQADFLQLWVNKTEFRIGDPISYHFESEKDCYLTLLSLTAGGDFVQVFPNKFNPDQFVRAGETYTIPEDHSDIALEVTGPPGKEEIVVLASESPFDLFSETFEEAPFFELRKEDQMLLNKIAENIQAAEKTSLAQKRISYSIID